MRKSVLCFCLFLAFVVIEASAWEKDVHYGLTKWLSFKAGFSLEDAEIVAQGTEAPDEGKLFPAPGAVFHSACLGNRDEDLARLVQQYHFPGYGPVPGQSDKRAVDPGVRNNAATDLAEKEIQSQLPSQPRERTLRSLGMALHPLEDSWSHQGTPDIPWTCSKDLSWGHPEARNGWRRHDADLTYLHPQDTLATAARVYEILVAFLKNHPAMKRDSKLIPPTWSSLEPEVKNFARASSKSDKRVWFQAQKNVPFQSYADSKFLDDINLPDDDKKKVALVGLEPTMPLPRQIPAAQEYFLPRDIEVFVENLLTLWLIKHDTEDLLRFTDVRQVTERFLTQDDPALRDTDPAAFTQLFYLTWLVRDHGFVNQLGHGLGRVSGTEKIVRASAQLDILRHEPQVQIRSLRGPEMSFHISRYVKSDDYAVIIEFAHAPRDACILTIGRSAVGNSQQFVVKQVDWYTL